MTRRRGLFGIMVCVCLFVSCQRVQQYPSISSTRSANSQKKDNDDAEALYRLSWIEPRERRDLPVVFVPSTRKEEWDSLPAYWTLFPMPTMHLGLPALQALTAIVLTEQHHAIKIKVPLGLPDPAPNIPRTNLPTFGKWQLGKKLFFEPMLKAGDDYYSCAKCHDPAHGFTEDSQHSTGGKYNTLSLINVVYNRRQFWDGRVQTLEETLVRDLDDERKGSPEQSKEKALDRHVWGGFVRSLVKQGHYDKEFDRVFGVPHPTQDTVAQALATYMRTILSGDSLVDRADAIRRAKNAPTMSVEHFRAALKDNMTVESLRDEDTKDRKVEEIPVLLAKGYELFHGKVRCGQCHIGPLFTDQDYHNVGYKEEEGSPPTGTETGRAVHVPIGQKESRLIGAFRTSSLRNLSKTYPYFHNGTLPFLRRVVKFYDGGIMPTPHLARALQEGSRELQLRLAKEEIDALMLFLRALDGTPVDANVASPPTE